VASGAVISRALRLGPISGLCALVGMGVITSISCANSGGNPMDQGDAGHTNKMDATVDAACGAIGQECCQPPTQCDVGSFCAPDNTCKNQHPSDIGQPCSSPSSCSSGICGYTQGIMDGSAPVPDGNGTPPPQPTGCTVGCYNTTPDCTPGWTCQQLSVGEGLCVCSWSAEICDGLDNNCDGIIDNEPEADNYCTMMDDGIPQKCVKGACVCENTCESNCVDIQNDPNNCGKCGKTCTPMVEKCLGGECSCAFTICDKTDCVNTKGTDNANCGGCGVPCAFQCADGQCGPVTLASTLQGPGSIMVDGTNVYWLDTGTGHTQVQYCPLAGCGGTPGVLAVSSAASSYSGQLGALAVTSTSVYFADDAGQIEVAPITGGSGTATVFSALGDSVSYVVASTTDVYWANEDTEDVEGCALGTSCATATSIANVSTDDIEPEGVAVSGSTVYWGAVDFDTETVSIQSAPTTSGTVTTLCTLSGVSSVVKDVLIVGGNLYFTSPGTAVHVCSLSSPGAAAAVYFADKNAPTGLATDGTNLYWTENETAGAILKCALGTSCASPTTVVSGVKNPVSIAVSATSMYWTSVPGTGGAVYMFHN
jgi:hypothetical protein